MNQDDVEKLKTELSQAKKKLADYAMMHTMLNRISSIESESDVIKGIHEIFTILCAPANLYYVPINDNKTANTDSAPGLSGPVPGKHDREIQDIIESGSDYLWSDSESGFSLKIKHINNIVGLIKIKGFTFPEYRHHYLNLALNITHVLGLAIDNSRKFNKLKQAKEEISKARKAAETANQAKSDFLASMSHELRTPLNGILGYSQILKLDACLTDSQKSGLNVIEQSGKHLLNLINEILDLSKIEARKMEIEKSDFSLFEFINSVANIIQVQANKKNIEFYKEISEDLPQAVSGDEKRIGQILLNLLSNAVKFTNKGEIRLQVFKSGENIGFKVSDSGIGIARDQLKDIFSPFKQVGKHARTIEGTGLGLAISQKLVRHMGGELHVNSREGLGSEFSFEIELPETNIPVNLAGENKDFITGYKYNGNRKKILVIDDVSANRSVLMGLLLPLGFEVHEAINGKEGVDKANECMPDLIFMDLVMPVMDGFEAARIIRKSEKLKHIILIAVSASTSLSPQDIVSKISFNAFIGKPVDFNEVMKALEKYLEIQWTYRENNSREPEYISEDLEMILPSKTDLEHIYQYSKSGDIMKIREKLDDIESRNPKEYYLFVNEIRKLAHSFQIKEIREKMLEYLEPINE